MPDEFTESAESRDALAQIWSLADGPPEALSWVKLSGCDPVLPSSFRVGTAAQATIAAAALAAADLWRLRGGQRQEVAVDMRHAAMEFRSERTLRVNGEAPPPLWDKVAGVYQTGDGRWVRIHTNFPHHRDGILSLLRCGYSREEIDLALKSWAGEPFETAVAERGLVATMMRSPEEWQAHGQGRAVARLPLFLIEKIAEAPPRPLPPVERPLAGVRVLDLTRIIAGPVCGRTLAAHGAEVMRVTAPHLPFVASLVMDAGRGKLSVALDLRREADRQVLRDLLRQADVFVQGYRPGAMARWGFSPEEAAHIRPGLVYLSLSAYGHEGPWSGRRGFDSLVQTASGLNHAEAAAAGVPGPKELPCQALDHASGYLMAFAAMVALKRRVTEGGSWHARVSLAQTGQWIQSLGRIAGGLDCPDVEREEISDLVEERESGFGRLTTVTHAGRLSKTPAGWARAAMPLGSHAPVWPG
ncbi:MAG: CoA transferase [Kiloniellales bacterium]